MYETPSYTSKHTDYLILRELEPLQVTLNPKNGHFWPFHSPETAKKGYFHINSTESCDHMYETPSCAIFSR